MPVGADCLRALADALAFLCDLPGRGSGQPPLHEEEEAEEAAAPGDDGDAGDVTFVVGGAGRRICCFFVPTLGCDSRTVSHGGSSPGMGFRSNWLSQPQGQAGGQFPSVELWCLLHRR